LSGCFAAIIDYLKLVQLCIKTRKYHMRFSFMLPLIFLGLTGCVVEHSTPPATPVTTTYVTPAIPTTTYYAPGSTTTVVRTP
jgi:hypothetical protein